LTNKTWVTISSAMNASGYRFFVKGSRMMAVIGGYLYTALPMSLGLMALMQCAHAQSTGGGSVRGMVTSDKGKALVAVVTVAKMTVPATSGQTQSTLDGSFGFDGLPAGEYAICARVPAGGFVDSCHWSPMPQTVTVKNGQSIIGVQIRVAAGSVLRIRLNDPGELLEPKGGVEPHVMMGVFTSRGLFQPTFLAAKDATGRNHEVTIPLDTPLKFHIFSKHLRINDENGVAVDSAGSTFAIKHTTGAASQKSFTFNVVAAIP
jgi:hypothetical protein